MPQDRPILRRPLRAVLVVFACLMVLTIGLTPLIVAEAGSPKEGFFFRLAGYCAGLSVIAIGLARMGPRALLWLIPFPAVMAVVWGVGMTSLKHQPDASLDEMGAWLKVLGVLSYGALTLIGGMAVWGWWLYTRDARQR